MKWFLITLLSSQIANASDWFCTEESGKRDGNTIMSCGVGDAVNDEGYARKKALQAAIEEFKTICDLSSDCRGKAKTVEPKRTSCAPVPNLPNFVRCYRLIVVTIVEE